MLALYGHPFSSYTWKALIALYADETPFEFRMVGPDEAENAAFVQSASPLGKFPVLADGDNLIFESTSIIEYLAKHYPGESPLIPHDLDAAIAIRMLDRVFDNYVMNVMQVAVDEYIRDGANAAGPRIDEVHAKLQRTYAWLEGWLEYYPYSEYISLVECAAAPSLFYADWVYEIPERYENLRAYRARLLARPSFARAVEEARPYRHFFPPGAPDRD